MNENSIQELIDSFIAYRNLIAPLRDSLKEVSSSYGEIRDDLDILLKNLSGNAAGQLEKVNATLNAQAKSGQELSRSIDVYSRSSEKYAQAVKDITSLFSALENRISSLEEMERSARAQIERIDSLIEEKKNTYNLKDLQKSLDRYNVNIEKISEFINRDIASVMKDNADKVEAVRKENEELKLLVSKQNEDIAALTEMFSTTTSLLRSTVEGNTVNEQYLFDVLDKWAADRKVRTKQK